MTKCARKGRHCFKDSRAHAFKADTKPSACDTWLIHVGKYSNSAMPTIPPSFDMGVNKTTKP